MDASRDDLRVLSIFHYVVAGIAGIFSLFPLIHVTLGVWMVSGRFPKDPRGNGPPELIGWFMIAIGVAIIAAGLSYAVLVAVAGRFVGSTRYWTFCVVMAALSCAFFPFGTVLGVFTVIVLSKPEVKARFQSHSSPPANPPAPSST
jgi:predicted membrane channel-forming protein YqfA (hemolysin III family)